jgi:APA family basic amino acid/polyamine antiporter
VSQAEVNVPAADVAPGLFARQSTGLVRGVPPRSSLIINFIPGHPTQTLAAVLLFALALGPGGNPFLALVLVVPMTLSFAYAFGFLTQMIPRSGGDYMLVSRVIHPAAGLISSFTMTMAGLLSNAFFGLAVVLSGLGPLLIGVGLIGHYPGAISFGQKISDIPHHKGWAILFGLVMFAFAGAIQLAGWRWLLRIQNLLFAMVTLSLVVCGLVALFEPKHSFISHFNSFAKPYTGKPDTYHQAITAAAHSGVAVHPAFSFSLTIPLIAVFATTAIYSYWATFVGGELRQASTIKTANNMALGGVIPIGLVMIFTLFFFKGFGSDFLRAANGGGLPSSVAVPGTPFFFLSGVGVGSTAYTLFVFILYIVFWPLITYISTLQQTRMLFAYSFDGILPKWMTKVNRYGCPWVALTTALLMSTAVFLWAVFNSTGFFRTLAYAVLIQVVAMGLVGIAAIVAPITRPSLYRASTSQKSFLGVPLVQIAGAGAVVSSILVWVLYLHYPALAIRPNLGSFFSWLGGTIAAAIAFFGLVYAYRRSQGVDISRVYKEIPPE